MSASGTTDLIDATSGAAGSLLTCVLLYPVDVAKTQIQSGRSKKSTRKTMQDIVERHGGLAGLFKGLTPKASHTVLQNFIYFYACAHRAAARTRRRPSRASRAARRPLTPRARASQTRGSSGATPRSASSRARSASRAAACWPASRTSP